ncbi:MAG: hypothetical protein H0U95_07375 [Bacteroidetes bacterium]|nr:hypothetical protein [Bacteroidota bacterium]
MRKFTLLFLFVASTTFINAQSDLYIKVKKALREDHPEISLDKHLIAVNIWSANNQESREANKQFNKNYSIYEFAKLKGGLKGLICVSINKEGESATFILNKDGATKLIQLNSVEVTNTPSNFVFDDQGQEVYKNIPSEKIFESINKLITR